MPRALVVDDDEAIRRMIVKMLERRGFEVYEAQTGEAAMALALERRPGIVICDTAIPGLGGMELYRRLAVLDLQQRCRGSSSSPTTKPRANPPPWLEAECPCW